VIGASLAWPFVISECDGSYHKIDMPGDEIEIHMDMGIQPSVGSLAVNIQCWARRSAIKLQRWSVSFGNQAKKTMILALSATWIQDTIAPAAVLAGAAAVGFWCASISAGLFGGAVLLFLAGIYKALWQIVAILRSERHRRIAANSNGSTSIVGERSERDFEVSARAIEHLRPWVRDETSLTEESAKACCSVLLDTLARLHPGFTQ
jgi:hypothetical protein